MFSLLEFRNDILKRSLHQRALKALSIVGLALTSSCGTSVAQTTDTANGGSSPPVVVTTPTPAPTPTPTPSPSLIGAATIADNFAIASAIETNPSGIPGPSVDPSGAFRMFCSSGQLLKDDPMVYPGQPGVSHLHQFFGNTGTNGNSDYASLRTSGGTTCGKSDAPANRSSYWFPAMLDGVGHVVKPDYVKLYYKEVPSSSADCQPAINPNARGLCVGMPNGIRFIWGYNMKTGTSGPTDTDRIGANGIRFECWASGDGKVTQGLAPGHYTNLDDLFAAGCPIGAQLIILVGSPDCWDGVNLDTADHRSHVVYGTGTDYGPGRTCDAQHPYVIPQITEEISFTIDANFKTWHPSSDEMVTGMKRGATFHLDYWEAWSPTVKAAWQQFCIEGHLSCSSGDLGNGTNLIGAGEPTTLYGKHELVPVP